MLGALRASKNLTPPFAPPLPLELGAPSDPVSLRVCCLPRWKEPTGATGLGVVESSESEANEDDGLRPIAPALDG